MSHKKRYLVLVASLVLLLVVAGLSEPKETVRVGMIPDAGANAAAVEQKKPLREYLEKVLGQPVELVIPNSYNATLDLIGKGSLDFAYLGALTYVKAHERYGVIPLVQRTADQQFHSVFITGTDSSIKTLADLKGKNFAFGDVNSTSGHLMPDLALRRAGIDPDVDFKFRYTGSHAATAKAVESGAADAGSLDETIFKEMTAKGEINPAKVHVFFTTPPFVDYVWVARKNVEPWMLERFSNALLILKRPHNADILDILRGDTFVRASDAEYDTIRQIGKQLSLLK